MVDSRAARGAAFLFRNFRAKLVFFRGGDLVVVDRPQLGRGICV
jgi:hypothetical protein